MAKTAKTNAAPHLTVVEEPVYDGRDIFQKISDGVYKHNIPYPGRKPDEPAVLRKRVKDLTPEEKKALPQIEAEYEKAKEEHPARLEAYRAAEADCAARFKADLEKEYGVENHPKKDKLYGLAYQEGHSGGFHEIASVYSTWVELLTD